MRKSGIIAAAILSLLATSCQKVAPLSDEPFMMSLSRIQARSIWVDIIPENNDFRYYYDIVTVKDYESFSSDEEFIKLEDALLHAAYDFAMEFTEEKIAFEDICLYRDAIYEAYYGNGTNIQPEETYYLYAFPYDSNLKPVNKLMKVKFTTPKEITSDITFTVSLEGSDVTVTPSNDKDTFLFDYNTESDINLSYFGSPKYFFNQMMTVYETYGFMESMLSKGKSTEDIAQYLTLNPGETVFLGVAGYENGLTTDITYYKMTYAGPDLPGKVELYEDEQYSSKCVDGINNIPLAGKLSGLAGKRTPVRR